MGLRHVFGYKPTPRLLDFLLVHRFWDYPLSELANHTKISYRTLQTVLPSLVKQGIVKETRTVSNAKFYKLDFTSSVVKKLDAFAMEADFAFAKEAQKKVAAVASTA